MDEQQAAKECYYDCRDILRIVCDHLSECRQLYGEQPITQPNGNQPGIETFVYNISRYRTWVQLFATMDLLPIMARHLFHQWPNSLRSFFWTIVPIWFLVPSFRLYHG